jgi:hypothetical protein
MVSDLYSLADGRLLQRMTRSDHLLCTAPMMDRTDSFSISIDCEAACAGRVHEGTAIDFAGVRRNAIFVSLSETATKKNAQWGAGHASSRAESR